jgi:hypothetical protein
VNAVGAPTIADLNGILHVVYLERNEDPRPRESPLNGGTYQSICNTMSSAEIGARRASLGGKYQSIHPSEKPHWSSLLQICKFRSKHLLLDLE